MTVNLFYFVCMSFFDFLLTILMYLLIFTVFYPTDYFYFIYRFNFLIVNLTELFVFNLLINIIYTLNYLNLIFNILPKKLSLKDFFEWFILNFLVKRSRFIEFSDYLWSHIYTQYVYILFYQFLNISIKISLDEIDDKNLAFFFNFFSYIITLLFIFIISFIFDFGFLYPGYKSINFKDLIF